LNRKIQPTFQSVILVRIHNVRKKGCLLTLSFNKNKKTSIKHVQYQSTEHLAENVPTILKDKLRKNFACVSKQTVIDYITQYATRHRYNPVLSAIQSVKWDGIDRVNQIYDIFRIPANTEEGMYNRIFIFKWLMQCVCGLSRKSIITKGLQITPNMIK